MKQIITIILLLSFSFAGQAMKKDYGKVSKEELAETVHPLEKDAKSAVIYQEAISSIEYNDSEGEFMIKTAFFKRIKVYDAADTDLGSVELPFYKGKNHKEKITGLKAATYNLKDGKIEKTKLSNKDVFEEETSEYYYIQKFAMPNVKEGSIIEYKYVLVSNAFSDVPKFSFQYDVPVNASFCSFEVPQYFDFYISSRGSIPLKKHVDKVTRQFQFTPRIENSTTHMGHRPNRSGGFQIIDYTASIHTYAHTNTPSLPDEDSVPYMDNYRSSLSFELLSIEFPGSRKKSYTNTWDKIADLLNNDSRFGKQIKKKLKKVNLNLDVAEGDKPLDVAKSVFYAIQNKATWDRKNGIVSQDGLADFAKDFKGNAADINLFLLNQLNANGITAYPVVMRRRDYGFMNHLHPTLDDLNYIIVLAEVEGKQYFLDATSKNHLFGNLPGRSLNRQGALINGVKGEVIDIVNPNRNKTQKIIKGTFKEDWSVELENITKYKDYAVTQQLLVANKYSDMDEWMEALESNNENAEYNNISLEKENFRDKGVIKNESLLLAGVAEQIDDKIYVNALLNEAVKTNPHVAEKREAPIFYNSIINESLTIQLEFPEGYKVESLPEDQTVALPDELGMYFYSVKELDKKLIIQHGIKMSTDMIPPNTYPYLKEFFDLIVAKGQEKIVLSK